MACHPRRQGYEWLPASARTPAADCDSAGTVRPLPVVSRAREKELGAIEPDTLGPTVKRSRIASI